MASTPDQTGPYGQQAPPKTAFVWPPSPLPEEAEPRAVVVLSGGAPNGAMTAGALAAIYSGILPDGRVVTGKTFNTIYASGAGALIGMLYAAPNFDHLPPPVEPDPNDPYYPGPHRPQDPTIRALRQVLKFGIEDEIYRVFPVGYKTFYKSGPFTESFLRFGRQFHLPERFPEGDGRNHYRRMFNDLVDLWTCAICPTDVTPLSQGLCGDFPDLKEIIDFEQLNNQIKAGLGNQDAGLRFYMNAHHIETQTMQEFSSQITPAHFDAALSYPFIYPPTRIHDPVTGKTGHYFEGGCVDPLNLEMLAAHIIDGTIQTRTVVIIDIIGTIESALVRIPQDLWDAFGISIMLPVVSLAKKSQTIYNTLMAEWNREHPERAVETIKLTFEIPPSTSPEVTTWSRSNMERCWTIGYEAGQRVMANDNFRNRLPDRAGNTPIPVSVVDNNTPGAVIGNLLNTLNPDNK